jgi:hypothetical protein
VPLRGELRQESAALRARKICRQCLLAVSCKRAGPRSASAESRKTVGSALRLPVASAPDFSGWAAAAYSDTACGPVQSF